MSFTLIRKELRDQRVFVWLMVVLSFIGWLGSLMIPLDQEPLGKTLSAESAEEAILFGLLAFAMGTGLLMREIENGTLAFLDGLPVTRIQLFVAKFMVAWAVLMIFPLFEMGLAVILHLASHTSLDVELHLPLLLTHLALSMLVVLVGLSAGLLFGYARSMSWMLLAVYAFFIGFLQFLWPRMAALNPASLFEVRYVGDHLLLPWETILTQSALVMAMTAFAGLNFVNDFGAKFVLWLKRPFSFLWLTLAALFLGGFVLAGIASSKRERAAQSENLTLGDAKFAPSPSGHSSTQHYTFSYPATHSGHLQELLTHADAGFEQVALVLGVEGDEAIDVDLSGSIANTAGIASGSRIRMSLSGSALNTLRHETTHVIVYRLSGGEKSQELRKMTVLNEGLAHWMESRAVGSPMNEADRLVAAVVSTRHLLKPQELADLPQLEKEIDGNLKYPLGAVFVDVLVARYGADAPKKVFQVLARPDFPHQVTGLAMWQATFQLAGFNLDQLFDDYAQRLNHWAAEFAPVIAALPRPRVVLLNAAKGVVIKGDFIGFAIELDSKLPVGWRAAVRVRPRDSSSLDEYRTLAIEENSNAWLSTSRIANGQVCFQPGLGSDKALIFEPWQCLSRDSAVEWKPKK